MSRASDPGVTAATFDNVKSVQEALRARAYLADEALATAIHVTLALDKPLLLEGEAGVGKTEVAKVMADALGRRLIRVQCYEGIDTSQALYEWAYARQLFVLRTLPEGDAEAVRDLFTPEFLVERPLLAALRAGEEAVLLIDELDRADDEFEAFLLELLSDFTVTIPEIGTVGCERPPAVVITSNRTRELHDALKRRCLYHWIDHPPLDREVAIIRLRAPEVPESLARQVASTVARLRSSGLSKRPGVAETIEWARALHRLDVEQLDTRVAAATLGLVVKDHDDLERARAQLDELGGPT